MKMPLSVSSCGLPLRLSMPPRTEIPNFSAGNLFSFISCKATPNNICVKLPFSLICWQRPTKPLYVSSSIYAAQRLCHGPELSSVGGASTLQHQSSGMPSLSTSTQQSTSISRGQFRTGLKTHLFNQAYNILWEHFVLRVYCIYLLTSAINYTDHLRI